VAAPAADWDLLCPSFRRRSALHRCQSKALWLGLARTGRHPLHRGCWECQPDL